MSNLQIKLYGAPLSGHCHRVELLLRMLGLPYEVVPTPPDKRSTKDFRALNPLGQVPVLIDNGLAFSDSNAILVYLVMQYAPNSHWMSDNPIVAYQIQRWLSIAAGELANGPNAARLMAVFGKPGNSDAIKDISARLLEFMESHLKGRRYLATDDNPTIADLACYSYIAHAPEGGIDLDAYPFVRSWLANIEKLPRFKRMPTSNPK